MNQSNLNLSDITSELRGKAAGLKIEEGFFTLALLTFTALNTLRLFSQSFAKLGPILAVAAILFFDGGFVYWGRRVRKSANGPTQARIAKLMRWVCGGAAVSMTGIDMLLHSGQVYIPLETEVTLYGGWVATVGEIAGGASMIILIAVIIANLAAVAGFEDSDIDTRQKIEEREAGYQNKARALSVTKAKNHLQGALTAEAVEQIAADYEGLKNQAAQAMSAALLPEIVSEWTADMRGARDGLVIPGTAHDVGTPALAGVFTDYHPHKCPNCGKPSQYDICSNCGFDRREENEEESPETRNVLFDVLEEIAALRSIVEETRQQRAAQGYAADVITTAQDEDRKNGHKAG